MRDQLKKALLAHAQGDFAKHRAKINYLDSRLNYSYLNIYRVF